MTKGLSVNVEDFLNLWFLRLWVVGGQEIQSKKDYLQHFPVYCIHAWHIMLGAPTSTSNVHCVNVENIFKVQSSCHELCLYQQCHIRTLLHCLSTHATLVVCHVQCTEIVDWAVSVWRNFGLVATSWLDCAGRGSTNHCLTHRSVLYTKAGDPCFVFCPSRRS